MFKKIKFAVPFAFALLSGAASAVPLTFSGSLASPSLPPFWTLSDNVDVSTAIAPYNKFSNGVISITFNGDFDESDANLLLMLESVDLGWMLNGNTDDDRWDHPTDAAPGHNITFSTSATLTDAELASILADGNIGLSIRDDYPAGGDWVDWINYFDYQISFDASNANAVPEPGSLALLGLGLAGVALRRRKRAA
ncbi:PEP-CTERM sorting domain-containing protein [Massilia sp.]|uniref:PEP-CTERM sorting domain-containing protein n=1 Tax=Massilia sp. TaxID=1882437 RepID=UPI00289C7134|nr:PEP-CTERM sorting domain-containing protein [Massilia sp.]